jgi:hexosaminidase
MDDHGCVTVSGPATVPDEVARLQEAGYLLRIEPESVEVTCSSRAGLVAALRTIGQLRAEDDSLPIGQITDQPVFRYRGVHLDVGRHYFDISFVRKYIRLAASLGFNVFHWHLTDDQGWRLPVPAYPRLAEVGAHRTEKDGSRYGGFYTADEISDVVAYAGLLGVLVIPEIELPGHVRSMIAAYPDLSCRGEPLEVPNEWGIYEDVLCVGNDAVFETLEGVFDQIVKLFPSRYVHIGGDECPTARWQECPKCRARMIDEGLARPEDLLGYSVSRAAKALADRDRVSICWDEVTEGEIPTGMMIMSWRGIEGGTKAARLGHQVIMTPTDYCYFDYRQEDRPDAPGFPYSVGPAGPPVLTIEKTYQFDPAAGLAPEESAHVIGGQANLWTEQIHTPAEAEQMVAPRILAMAEALWTAPKDRDFAEFASRARAWLPILEETGWTYTDVPELRSDD